jgi:hypothetical protein
VNRCHLCNELSTREYVRGVLKDDAAEMAEELMFMRGKLDWISEEWAAEMSSLSL